MEGSDLEVVHRRSATNSDTEIACGRVSDDDVWRVGFVKRIGSHAVYERRRNSDAAGPYWPRAHGRLSRDWKEGSIWDRP